MNAYEIADKLRTAVREHVVRGRPVGPMEVNPFELLVLLERFEHMNNEIIEAGERDGV